MKSLLNSLLLLTALSLPAFASTRTEAIADALKQAKAAAEETEDASAACRKKVAPRVDELIDSLRELKSGANDKQVKKALSKAEDAVDLAKDACSGAAGKRVAKPLEKVVASLEAAQTASDAQPAAAAPQQQGGILGINVNLAGGLGGLFGGGSSTTTSSSTSHKTTKTVEEINGHPVGDGDDGDEEDARPKKKAKESKADFGATCRKNSECSSNTCFVGNGELGYCTKMCDSWSDCPSFWECKKAGNAPQRICMQGN